MCYSLFLLLIYLLSNFSSPLFFYNFSNLRHLETSFLLSLLVLSNFLSPFKKVSKSCSHSVIGFFLLPTTLHGGRAFAAFSVCLCRATQQVGLGSRPLTNLTHQPVEASTVSPDHDTRYRFNFQTTGAQSVWSYPLFGRQRLHLLTPSSHQGLPPSQVLNPVAGP